MKEQGQGELDRSSVHSAGVAILSGPTFAVKAASYRPFTQAKWIVVLWGLCLGLWAV